MTIKVDYRLQCDLPECQAQSPVVGHFVYDVVHNPPTGWVSRRHQSAPHTPTDTLHFCCAAHDQAWCEKRGIEYVVA